MDKITKILLMGKNGEYNIAKKTQDGLSLEPSSKKVFAREVVPYGFDFNFGGIFEDTSYGIMGYSHPSYKDKGKNGKIPQTNKEYGQINLELTIEGLEKDVQEIGADYVLLNRIYSRDNSTSWEISGKAKFLIKR